MKKQINNNILSESGLLSVGLGLFIVTMGMFLFLQEVALYNDFVHSPLVLRVLLTVLFLLAILFCFIGSILTLTRQSNTSGFVDKLSYFLNGFWSHAKLPILIVLLMGIILGIWSLVTF